MTTVTTALRRPRADGRPRLRGLFHAATLPVAILGALLLWQAAGDSWPKRAPVLVFAVTLVGLYSVSSAYHLGPWSERARALFARFDGAMIQLFIAGTFTPVAFFTLDGNWRTWSLIVAWTIAVVGAGIAISPLKAPRWVGTAGYLAVGWLLVVPMSQIIFALPWEGVGLIVLGGVLYTIGGVVYAKQWPNPFPKVLGFHEVFHLLVVAASTAHYIAIWRYVLPGG